MLASHEAFITVLFVLRGGVVMILYRGTPEPESLPELRAHPVIFFAYDFNEAKDYATGGEQENGYIQEYFVPDGFHLLDLDEPEGTMMMEEFLGRSITRTDYNNILHYPTREWVEFVSESGFEGIIGNYVLLFRPKSLRLLRRWRLDWNEERRRYDERLIYQAAA